MREDQFSGNENLIIGRNPVMEALKSGREIEKLQIAKDAEGSIRKIIGLAKDKSIPYQFVEKSALDRIAEGRAHQGVIASCQPLRTAILRISSAIARQRGRIHL